MRLIERVEEETKDRSREAAGWLLRLHRGPLTAAEKAEFSAWHADEENADAYTSAARIWHAVDEISGSSEILQERENVIAKVTRRRTYFTVGIAASVAASIVLFLPVVTNLNHIIAAMQSALFGPAPIESVYETDVGERSLTTLSDGSVLRLNTESAAHVRYDGRERAIILVKGQALFEVAKNQPKPFVVYAGNQRIVATGTEFDVRVNDAAVEVTLVEGHVAVGQSTAPGERNSSNKRVEMNAGERLVARKNASSVISAVNVSSVTSWTEGKLVFRDTRLIDAIAETNRYTRTPLILVDPTLADLRISGVFRAGQPAEFARAVEEIYPITVKYLPDGQISIAKK